MTKRKPFKHYSAEFKKEVIRRANEEGTTDQAACDGLDISTRQFRRWQDEIEVFGKDVFPRQRSSA